MQSSPALSRLAHAHDTVTRVGFALAALCLTVIVCAYSYEVGARYLFHSPTTWASSLVSYMLCCMVFLAMPELTRSRVHIFISIFLDTLSVEKATKIQRVTYLVAGLACIFAGSFCLWSAIQQFERGISTVNEWRIPKWWLSGTIGYGLLSAGIHYFRHFVDGVPYQSSEAL